jgi:hypothetical protein
MRSREKSGLDFARLQVELNIWCGHCSLLSLPGSRLLLDGTLHSSSPVQFGSSTFCICSAEAREVHPLDEGRSNQQKSLRHRRAPHFFHSIREGNVARSRFRKNPPRCIEENFVFFHFASPSLTSRQNALALHPWLDRYHRSEAGRLSMCVLLTL